MNETINQTVTQVATLLGHTAPFTFSPALDIYLISFFISLFITLVNKYMSDQEKMKSLRKEMKESQKKLREMMKTNPKKAQQMQKEHTQKSMELMKHSMNPKTLLTTMLPVMLVFTLVLPKYYSNLGEFFTFFGITIGFLGQPWGWLGTYIFFSIVNSIILKKVLDVA